MNKPLLVNYLKHVFLEKIEELKNTIAEVQNSANQESKSSVGDKYETARAMAQNEVFMLNSQLSALQNEYQQFINTPFQLNSSQVRSGSLVKTTQGYFLISAALGKINFEGTSIFCISPKAPIALLLMGKTKQDYVEFNKNKIQIIEII